MKHTFPKEWKKFTVQDDPLTLYYLEDVDDKHCVVHCITEDGEQEDHPYLKGQVKEIFAKGSWKFVEDGVTEIVSSSALDSQVGGDHYKNKGIQPVEYCYKNNLGFLEANVVKYVSRHKDKNKEQDILKAIHYCKFILEFEYGIKE